jgi:hypothetical protein
VTVPDYRANVDKSCWVDVTASVDATGTARWTMRTLDPSTGDLPEDALAGFLPVNDSTGRGQGHVSFTIKPRAGVAVGTLLANKAVIRFDIEAPIETGEVLFTVVGHLPSRITDLRREGGLLHFTATGLIPNIPVVLEQSLGFSGWTTVTTGTPAGTTQSFSVTITADPNTSFFRLRQNPPSR